MKRRRRRRRRREKKKKKKKRRRRRRRRRRKKKKKKNETNLQEKAKKRVLAENVEDMALVSMHQYLSAKHLRRKERLNQNSLIPIDNVSHSLWSGCNVMMNGELVSTRNQKYM